MLLPLRLMLDRVDRHGSESDSSLFAELLYAGEFVLKLTVAAFISAIEDDRENHRYRILHGLVRADGLGEWSRSLDEVLVGPTTQHLSPDFSDYRKIFTERVGKGQWQYECVSALQEVLAGAYEDAERMPDKVALRSWFQKFTELRNKTRGHGAPTPAKCARLVPMLQGSIRLFCERNPLFALPWAYLHRNMSGKYRVTTLGGDQTVFADLKSAEALKHDHLTNGVYYWNGRYRSVELVYSDLDASDFYFPNGTFGGGTYELHSLITDSRLKGDAAPYMAVASERPPSETHGKGILDVVGRVFTNLPPTTLGYVQRPLPEKEVSEALVNDRHPIVTLVGGGGIGKTSLVLKVLHDIATTERFSVIIWFSARDIDLTMSGAKSVQPSVVTDREIANEYCALIGEPPKESPGKFNSLGLLTEHLRQNPNGPTLFVFDNFETVRNPVDLFKWIDTNIRLPNKVAITTRFRDFKADYPIPIKGMETVEAAALIQNTVASLKIGHLIGPHESSLLIDQSDGHPYVIKIMLGEVANAGTFSKPSKLIARKDDILDALFERTFANLSPIASRIFLTLSGWRSLVPQLAVEAVLLRHGDEGANPEAGIDELLRMSLIERSTASDGADVLGMPLSAALFGKRKLDVSPIRTVIEDDVRFLQDIGAMAESALGAGVGTRLESFFRKTARRINSQGLDFEKTRPVLEFLARGYPRAWLWLAELEQELGDSDSLNRAAECVRRYLETRPDRTLARDAWRQLFGLYQESNDVVAGCSAFLSVAEIETPPLEDTSAMANWLNNSMAQVQSMDVTRRAALYRPLAQLMEQYVPDASATDLSRLAWLHLHCDDHRRALEVAQMGLKREPNNMYCRRLVERLIDPR